MVSEFQEVLFSEFPWSQNFRGLEFSRASFDRPQDKMSYSDFPGEGIINIGGRQWQKVIKSFDPILLDSFLEEE